MDNTAEDESKNYRCVKDRDDQSSNNFINNLLHMTSNLGLLSVALCNIEFILGMHAPAARPPNNPSVQPRWRHGLLRCPICLSIGGGDGDALLGAHAGGDVAETAGVAHRDADGDADRVFAPAGDLDHGLARL